MDFLRVAASSEKAWGGFVHPTRPVNQVAYVKARRLRAMHQRPSAPRPVSTKVLGSGVGTSTGLINVVPLGLIWKIAPLIGGSTVGDLLALLFQNAGSGE
jgi:hypothetical protein